MNYTLLLSQFLLCATIVPLTFNPTDAGFHFFGWEPSSKDEQAGRLLVAAFGLIFYVVVFRAASEALGFIGICGGIAFFGIVGYVAWEWDILAFAYKSIGWFMVGSAVLMCFLGWNWSKFRKRMSGQIDST